MAKDGAEATTKQSDANELTDFGRRTWPSVHALHAEVNGCLASPRHDYRTIPTDAPHPVLYALPHHTGILINPLWQRVIFVTGDTLGATAPHS